MSLLYKVSWALRYALYSIFVFGRAGLPGYIGRPIFMMNPKQAYLGKKVRIFPGMRLEIHNQGLVNIGNNIAIGQNLHLTCGESLKIGDGTIISGNVVVTDIEHNYEQVDVSVHDQGIKTKPTVIGENCFIGFGASIQPGTVLGKQCVVGANSVVKGVFPNYSVIVGSPAKAVKQLNNESLKWERL